MNKAYYILTLVFLLFSCQKKNENTETSKSEVENIAVLKSKIEKIISNKKSTVGVAVIGPDQDTLSIRGDQHFPLQSVFKLHIALAMLHQIEEGKFSLKQEIKIGKEAMMPNLYSPIRDKYPNGVTLPLSEIIKYTVSNSDNVGCDLLLEMLGGPEVVEDYFKKNNFQDISIKINEKVQQANWDQQFLNWTTPKAANEVLKRFFENKPALLNNKNYDFIWKTLKETNTGEEQLKGQLTKGTVVAHKTGHSGANEKGVTEAVNNIGVVFLPNGKHYFISVLISNSTESFETNKKIISDISKATYDHFVKSE